MSPQLTPMEIAERDQQLAAVAANKAERAWRIEQAQTRIAEGAADTDARIRAALGMAPVDTRAIAAPVTKVAGVTRAEVTSSFGGEVVEASKRIATTPFSSRAERASYYHDVRYKRGETAFHALTRAKEALTNHADLI